MRKGTFIAIIALLIAIAGAIVAFAAYFKRHTCTLCDDFDEDSMGDDVSDLDYYATQVNQEDPSDEDACAEPICGEPATPEQPQAAAAEEKTPTTAPAEDPSV